jgi:hypothetical protein
MSTDYTNAARCRRYRARRQGESVPLHKAGRPYRGCSALVAYAPLDALLKEVVDRVSHWDDDDERLWDVMAAIEGLEEALRRFPGVRSPRVPPAWLCDDRMLYLLRMRDSAEGTVRDIRRLFAELGDASQRWLDSAGVSERIAAREQVVRLQREQARLEQRQQAEAARELELERNLATGRGRWLEYAD